MTWQPLHVNVIVALRNIMEVTIDAALIIAKNVISRDVQRVKPMLQQFGITH